MENFIFLNYEYFLIFFVALIFIAYLFFSNKKSLKFEFYKDLKKVYGKSSFFYYLFFILLTLVSLFFSIILANPNLKNQSKQTKKNGIDIVLVLDISYSMEAQDLTPNRIESAKIVIDKFLQKLKTDRVGLVLFAGKPFLSIPLNYDYKFLQEYLKDIGTQTINQNNFRLQGTAIGDAMLVGSNLFDEENKDREKVMILLTDGEANKGISPQQSLKLLKEKNIKTYTIGVGGLDGGYIYSKDILGRTVKTKVAPVDEKILKKIAKETSGKYYRASSNETFLNIFNDINKLEKKEIVNLENDFFTTKYGEFFYILLFLELFLSFFIWKKIKI